MGNERKPEVSAAQDIAPLFAGLTNTMFMQGIDALSLLFIGEIKNKPINEKDPCENCNGSDCPPLEEAGITCMGIEGLLDAVKNPDCPGLGRCKDCGVVLIKKRNSENYNTKEVINWEKKML